MPTGSQQLDPRFVEQQTNGSIQLIDAVFALLGVGPNMCLLPELMEAEENPNQPWVLSIEDDDDVAISLTIRLKELGVKMIRATAGTEGYRRAFLDAPSAIILDYELPDGNGAYVLRRLRESAVTRNIPVIVLTGHRDPFIERQMRSLGVAEFLQKPLQWSLLRTALTTILASDRPSQSESR